MNEDDFAKLLARADADESTADFKKLAADSESADFSEECESDGVSQ